MAGDDRRALHFEVAFDDVQVGSTDAARAHFDPNFIGTRLWDRDVIETQRMTLDGGGGV
jgi:hypothetical protein